MRAPVSNIDRRGVLRAGLLGLFCLVLALAPSQGRADDARPGTGQLAQAPSPFLGKWLWSSPWGPLTLNITEVLPDGRTRGQLAITVYKGVRRFTLADKASGVEMVGKITDGQFVGKLKSGTTMWLKPEGANKLVGPYHRGDGQKQNAVFVK